MQNQAEKIQAYILKNTPKHPSDIVKVSMDKFNVSRTTILRHINHLVKENKIVKSGTTRQICYAATSELNRQFIVKLYDNFDEYRYFAKHFEQLLSNNINEQAFSICEYVITELLNNCKDHSRGTTAKIEIKFDKTHVFCSIIDNGVGAFQTISEHYNFSDQRDIIFELSKGKLTRDPSNHTGEGIFFSSRAVDEFTLSANGYSFYRNNQEHDWTLEQIKLTKGTSIQFSVNKHTKTDLHNLFQKYTDDLAFSKTEILIDLSKHIGERLISRSQAKRATRRLDEFSHVTLDFKNVKVIGQGFADEVFRVYQQKHPSLIIEYINANEDIEFMIKRTIATM